MSLTDEQRQYVVRSVVRILKDVNRDDIIAALKEEVLETEQEGGEDELELDMIVLAVAEACRERLELRSRGRGEVDRGDAE
jgi:hypothetical protein